LIDPARSGAIKIIEWLTKLGVAISPELSSTPTACRTYLAIGSVKLSKLQKKSKVKE
jgi:hypothetical protein